MSPGPPLRAAIPVAVPQVTAEAKGSQDSTEVMKPA